MSSTSEGHGLPLRPDGAIKPRTDSSPCHNRPEPKAARRKERETEAMRKPAALVASGTIAAGGTDTLTFDFSLPTSAGNTFQTLTQDFTITYTATQLAGTAR